MSSGFTCHPLTDFLVFGGGSAMFPGVKLPPPLKNPALLVNVLGSVQFALTDLTLSHLISSHLS